MGEVYEYLPNLLEVSVALMVWAVGLLVFTVMVKIAVAVECGDMRDRTPRLDALNHDQPAGRSQPGISVRQERPPCV